QPAQPTLARASQQLEAISALVASSAMRMSDESGSELSDLSDLDSANISTTQRGLQRSEGLPNTYVPGTVPERLYKRAQMAHEIDGAYQLTPDVFAPTQAELRAAAAEVGDEALTNAIAAI